MRHARTALDMDTTQIEMAFSRLFNEERQRIVFWNDPEREFEDVLPSLRLDGHTSGERSHLGRRMISGMLCIRES